MLPVHVYGNICDVEGIQQIADKHGLKVIYDAAHAFGVKYKNRGIGIYGDASMFSFHATKVYNTIEGGAICHHSKEFGNRLYQLKNFGIRNEETVDAAGSNAKMNELQAVMELCNLKHLEEEIDKRKKVVCKYRECLAGIKGIKLNGEQPDVKSNYAYFPVEFEDEFGCTRDEVYDELKKHNIFSRKYFYPVTNTFECYKDKFSALDTPAALDVSCRILTLPLYADLELEDVERVCEVIKNIAGSK
ncbi:hypothetical protein DW877_10250 [[Clostridium] symbiosum]|nr:hypothetical protein DW877_10250 [[Clostridium] symbiosum]